MAPPTAAPAAGRRGDFPATGLAAGVVGGCPSAGGPGHGRHFRLVCARLPGHREHPDRHVRRLRRVCDAGHVVLRGHPPGQGDGPSRPGPHGDRPDRDRHARVRLDRGRRRSPRWRSCSWSSSPACSGRTWPRAPRAPSWLTCSRPSPGPARPPFPTGSPGGGWLRSSGPRRCWWSPAGHRRTGCAPQPAPWRPPWPTRSMPRPPCPQTPISGRPRWRGRPNSERSPSRPRPTGRPGWPPQIKPSRTWWNCSSGAPAWSAKRSAPCPVF